ncbi:MAG: N-acetyltransferase [Devosia sp.]|nr:N-acetyltransferase [Devosia sp.]
MQIIAPTAEHVPLLQSLMRATFTETFGHLYPAADLAHYLDTAYAPGQLRSEVADRWNFWQLALDNTGSPVGYLECLPAHLPHPDMRPEEHGEIERIYVLKSHQGKGLGRKLMAIALDHLGSRYGNAPQWLGVWSENLRAQVLYRAYGFEKVGEYEFPVGETRDREFIFCRIP